MPVISKTLDYNGFATKAARLGLDALAAEAASTLSFRLDIAGKKLANGTKGIRQSIDLGFAKLGGWTKITSGGIDWTKRSAAGGATVGVEVQVSGRSDMLAVDVMHLREDLVAGVIDIGIIIVPDDVLSPYLTDRTPNLATAVKHVEHRAKDLPIIILAFGMMGPGPHYRRCLRISGRDAQVAVSECCQQPFGCRPRQSLLRHLIEHPIAGTCSTGARPVRATCTIAS